eukprot:m.89686 g.89686  ORF g.89686 m.89686 type:complete len:306 (+) comp8541_c0_seq2:433-1350(+)
MRAKERLAKEDTGVASMSCSCSGNSRLSPMARAAGLACLALGGLELLQDISLLLRPLPHVEPSQRGAAAVRRALATNDALSKTVAAGAVRVVEGLFVGSAGSILLGSAVIQLDAILLAESTEDIAAASVLRPPPVLSAQFPSLQDDLLRLAVPSTKVWSRFGHVLQPRLDRQAFVICHEIAHIRSEHPLTRALAKLTLLGAALALAARQWRYPRHRWLRVLSIGAGYFGARVGVCWTQELSADRQAARGDRTLAEGGIEHLEAALALRQLRESIGQPLFIWTKLHHLMSHPPASLRLAQLEGLKG